METVVESRESRSKFCFVLFFVDEQAWVGKLFFSLDPKLTLAHRDRKSSATYLNK
jgi:hypothetical protein